MKKVEPKLSKLNLGIQVFEGFDKVSFDVQKFPWPLKDESVSEFAVPMVLNYTPAAQRGKFMDEMYRVLVPEGKATVIVPYYTSMRSIQDYASQWPPFCEVSFMYFNRAWRKLNHPERDLKCNFDFTYGYQADPETAAKNDETRAFWIKHYANSVMDLTVVLVKKP
jgi:hypothetical protein